MAVKQERKYDLVILGGATQLGGLVVRHIQAFLPKDLKWALAGTLGGEAELYSLVGNRSPGKDTPAIEICSFTKETITALVKSTKVTIVLPSISVKDETQAWIIEACARNGTHYVDAKSGETCWLKAMIQKYHPLAEDSNAILLSHINATGATQDLLTFCAVTDLNEKLSLKTKEAICSFPVSSYGRQHHTPHNSGHRRRPSRDATPPWYLSSTQGREGSCNTNAFGVRKELSLGTLANSSHSAASNRVLVHRSWGLLDGGAQYGRDFFYNEFEEVPNTLEGIKARIGKRRRVAEGCFRRGKNDETTVHLKVVAVADQEGPFPDRALAELVYHEGETSLTAALVVQAASTLLYTKNTSKTYGGGFLTPAVLGTRYVERLRGVGMEIECSLL